jgi:hypothetical protein
VPALVLLIASWNYRWVQEDALINFRIIGNLLPGHGPVYNIGERVEAYTDPLSLFLLALVHEVLQFASLEGRRWFSDWRSPSLVSYSAVEQSSDWWAHGATG